MTALALAKRSVRRELVPVLGALPRHVIEEQSRQILARLLAMPAYVNAEAISVYLSMPSGEVETWDMCSQILAHGKRLYIPRFSTVGTGEGFAFTRDMNMLRVFSEDELRRGLLRNSWGIDEPTPKYMDAPREDALEPCTGGQGLDLVIVPGVAFDRQGGRLGHGKGYYDRYIQRARAFAEANGLAPPPAIALALAEQVRAPCVPTGEMDVPMDAILTAEEAVMVHRNAQ
ncbi:5-formyltetrahydrofolate cyclo-ligase [Malassezia vespertilionis]|uniref:5-formyltetrahydrofolate cyclo-ligase n=1 Tax=Malassezia vespertilionis TaxID=2020962 RepID=A0A2N1JC11_9BASI|nr:5-formyltetrahydrofolate cyclo-ligase [Malassezia vespertilionis]PKI84067.1 Fau1p [Malassezia vespertilionis]WFD06795.1 5-formyltetrahydrofolate cyclo-ligase [Malassezia vespertilionis]